MLIRRESCGLAVARMLAAAVLFEAAAYGQASAASPASLESEVAGIKADNAALRDQVRRLEEQQKTLLDLVGGLQRRLDNSSLTAVEGPPAPRPDSATAAIPLSSPATTEAELPSPVATAGAQGPQAPSSGSQALTSSNNAMDRPVSRYDDGIVIAQSSDDAKVPFYLKFNNITQFRYTNTQPENTSFTDHLGVSHPVEGRNDFSLNRNLFMFNGYVFDKRLQYNLITWASNSLASVIAGGIVGWQFNQAITAYAGYWSIPGSRSLTSTFPYFIETDRSLADNFFRPGFTQGIWFAGQPAKGLNYNAFIGNGLNTLTIPTVKIDRNLVYSGSAWWEPLAPWGPPGRTHGMYDDYSALDKPAIRIGASYTRSREDRFSNLDQKNPENTSMYNSDGVLTFATGAFAPGVTLQEATYRMLAVDAGFKYKGLAINAQYFFRWLNDFVADGPLPIASTFDHGGELSIADFVIPRRLELYARGSGILGQFGNSYEYAPGFKWYPVNNWRVWIVGEALRVHRSSVGSIITPYTAGMTGWEPLLQLMFNF